MNLQQHHAIKYSAIKHLVRSYQEIDFQVYSKN